MSLHRRASDDDIGFAAQIANRSRPACASGYDGNVNIELLKELTEAHGTSGYEDEIRIIVRRELEGICEITSDAMGNLICLKRGNGAKKVMIAAHMDEIGFVVRHIEEKGFLRLATLGGWDPRQMNSQRVVVRTKEGHLNGVLMYGTKPAHMLTDSEKNEGQKHDNFFVDLGLSADEVKTKVRLGDSVTMDRNFLKLGHLFTCKSMDDRVAVFVMIEALKAAKSHEADIYAVATVQEEIGLRGAAAAGWSVQPDVAIAIDITLANDIPGIGGADEVTRLGAGAAIKVLDSSLICHPKVVGHFRSLAEDNEIPHQMEILTRGGTDAGAIQRLHGGIPSFTLSIPTRYVHTVNETVHQTDVQACIDLMARYIEDAHNGSYEY
jgi:endoglucanase